MRKVAGKKSHSTFLRQSVVLRPRDEKTLERLEADLGCSSKSEVIRLAIDSLARRTEIQKSYEKIRQGYLNIPEIPGEAPALMRHLSRSLEKQDW